MRRSVASLLLAVLVITGQATSAAAAGPKLSPGGKAEFPHRSYILSLPPGTSAEPGDVRVFENGDPVHGLRVHSAGSADAGRVGTVLVIDASNSMRGAPIRRAMAAARVFAAQRHPSQALGVVVFNRSTRTVLEPSTDDAAIENALAQPPPLAKWTRVRDGALSGLQALDRGNITVGSVVVLSDGADTGSRAQAAQVADIADRLGARVFTVGLESRDFKPETLQQLADVSGGEYTAAHSPKDLRGIYDELGARLASEYVVQYSSVAGRGKRVQVDAIVDGFPGSASLTYTAPRLKAGPAAANTTPKANGLWGSAAVMILVAFGSAFLVCFGIAWALSTGRRSETAEERVAAFVAMGEEPSEQDREQRDSLYDRVEHGLRGHAWWVRFSTDVEIARLDRKPAQIAVVTAATTLFVMWLFAKISGAGWVALFAFLVPWGVHKFVTYRAAKQRTLFGEQLADNLQVIASAMRAGQSFGGALAVAVEDAPEPAKKEFERVVADEQLGVPLENSLGLVVDRMDNRDLHQVVLVAALQREAGGNSAEVLDRVADTIRERVALRRLISTLTAQGRLSRWVVSLVPVGLILFIGLTKPGYLDPLFKTTVGNVLLVVAFLMGVSGSLAIKRIVQIKV